MLIRPAKIDDTPAIAQLWLQLVQYHRALDIHLPQAAPDGQQRYAQRVRSQIDDPYSNVFVAIVDDEIVGYVMGVIVDMLPEMFQDERGGFLADIFVRDDQRGKGIGRGLVKALKDWFRGRGIDHFEWYVAAANTDGIAFWRAMGGADVMVRMRASTGEGIGTRD